MALKSGLSCYPTNHVGQSIFQTPIPVMCVEDFTQFVHPSVSTLTSCYFSAEERLLSLSRHQIPKLPPWSLLM